MRQFFFLFLLPLSIASVEEGPQIEIINDANKHKAIDTNNLSIKVKLSNSKRTNSGTANVDAVLAYPVQLTSVPTLHPGSKLHVDFNLIDKDDAPLGISQVVLSLVHQESGYQVSKPITQRQPGQYRFDWRLDTRGHVFNAYPGSWCMAVVLGDVALVSPVKYELGCIDAQFERRDVKQHMPVVYAALPEIAHQFKASDKAGVVSPLVSIVWSVLVVMVPWMLLGWLWTRIEVNVARFPLHAVADVAFLAAVMLYAVIVIAFWMRLSIFSLLTYLAVLLPIGAICGRATLRARALAK